jgi:hypothetical protein
VETQYRWPWRLRVARVLALAALCIAAPATFACECSFGPLVDRTVRDAREIFVFRLEAAELEGSKPGSAHRVRARIEVVDWLLSAAAPREIEYSTHWCCGSSLHLGHFYAAFLSDAPGFRFRAHSGNLLPLGLIYDSHQRERLDKVVHGSAPLEACFGEWPSTKVEIDQPPPPPLVLGEDPPKKDWGPC